MKNPLGSEMFGTAEMRTDECALMALVMKSNGTPSTEIIPTILAIDDLLRIQKMQTINTAMAFTRSGRRRKNSRLSELLAGRIDALITELNH